VVVLSAGAQYNTGSSIYGSPAGKGIRSGSQAIGGQYNLAGSGYSRVYHQQVLAAVDIAASGTFGTSSTLQDMRNSRSLRATGSDGKLLLFDPQITTLIEDQGALAGGAANGAAYTAIFLKTGALSGSSTQKWDSTLVKNVALVSGNVEAPAAQKGLAVPSSDIQSDLGVLNIRRLNEMGTLDIGAGTFTPDPLANPATLGAKPTVVKLIVSGTTGFEAGNLVQMALIEGYVSYPISDNRASGDDGDSLVVPAFESNFGTTPSPEIPEIDIKVQSIAVTAQSRKLRARWSPELAQDLNAYHSLDAEVELTQILSEQIALEIDREILNDLLTQADTRYYWSRKPGQFVNKKTAKVVSGASFTGTVREWYETLIETIIDVGNEIHRKTLRGSANFIVVSPEVATILEASVMYRPSYTLDAEGQVGTPFTIGAEKVGTLSNRFTVYKDPYFPRNQILVGYKGGSYLETGYVYAPYVPLIVTPTIFAPEDFTPRKGVMTRYGKKMVRSDFYGSVTCTWYRCYLIFD
jgi:hypothetical protein